MVIVFFNLFLFHKQGCTNREKRFYTFFLSAFVNFSQPDPKKEIFVQQPTGTYAASSNSRLNRGKWK